MNNSKQWAKAIMAMAIGVIPISIASYSHATWYFVFLLFCSLFGVLGLIALFQLFIYTILFPKKRSFLVKTVFYISVCISISLPIIWILHHETHPYSLLTNNYEITEATLIQKEPCKNNDSTIIEYAFKIKDKQYFSKKNSLRIPKNNTFYIKYLPENPYINELADE